MSEFCSGFISIIGCPNVGKSTLINRLVGQKIAIVTHRAQTTRNKIMGVVNGQDWQMVFLDTPGITGAKNRLGDYMQKTAAEAMRNVEAILLVLDPTQGVRERDQGIMEQLKGTRTPVIAFINKSDLATPVMLEEARAAVEDGLPGREIFTGSGKTGQGTEALIQKLLLLLAEGPRYFPEDMVTDQPERVICQEMIREKALLNVREEIPHGVGVGVDKMEKRPDSDIMDIYATIYCERDSHKGILIGKGGSMLKRIGSDAREDMEWLLDCRVNLQLWIKVKEDWRNKPAVLHELGYE